MKNKTVIFENLGLIDYKKAWDYQETLFQEVIAEKLELRKTQNSMAGSKNYLLFCQHPHVYTLGKTGNEANMLLTETALKTKGATYYKINRGGDITYHGPGQLVGYPILNLDNFFTDIHKYLRLLEQAIINTLAQFDIEAGRVDKLTGVWVIDPADGIEKKICAMGVRASRWVTMHGFAFNIEPDLSYFKNIVPCGISDKPVTSLAQLTGQSPNFDHVSSLVKKHLIELFEMEIK